MPRWVSATVALIAAVALLSSGAFVLARWYGLDALASVLGPTLQYSLMAVIGCCVYAGLVGVYHTFLSVTGLDEDPRKRERREAKERSGDEPRTE
jgi:hypothetical protein